MRLPFPSFKHWLIRQKILFITVVITAISLLLALTTIFFNDIRLHEREKQRRLETLTQIIGANTQAALAFGDAESAVETLSTLRAEANVRSAAVYREDGTLFAAYVSADSIRPPASIRGDEPVFSSGEHFKQYAPILLNQRHIGTIFLEKDTKDLRDLVGYYLRLLFMTVLASVALAALLSHALQRLVSQPILELTALTQRVSAEKDYSLRAHRESNDEIGVLINNFNEMLSEIQNREHELRLSNKELGQFAYIASHDLQEPLRKIITFSERIGDTPNLTPAQRDYFERINNAGRRMKTVIEDLLQYSRISRGETAYEECDLNDILKDVLSDLELRINESKAAIELSGLPRKFLANASQMRHLFQNLITNSIKFARKDAPPRIRVSGETLPSGETTLRVADNGIGFEEKYVEKIFQPFQRLHGKNEYEGTGIGLSIAQKIVQNHGGRITAKSTPGAGSEFIMTFPGLPQPLQVAAA